MVRLILGLITMPLALIETAMVRHQTITVAAIGNLLIYPLLVTASIVVHEAGHAVVAHLVGLRVLRIELGVSRRWARWRWGTLRFQLNTLPLLGLTTWGAESPVRRWQPWLATLAGPVATLAILLATLAAGGLGLSDVLWPSGAVAGGLAIAPLLAFQNFWALVRNLLPIKIAGFHTDGRQLLRIPFLADRELELLRLVAPMLETAEHIEDRRLDDAARTLDGLRETAPDSLYVRCDSATVTLLRGQHAEARAQFIALAAEPELPSTIRWLVLNNAAWSEYMIDDPGLRDDADRHSQEALALAKHSPHAMGTRGAILGWLGRHGEALDLLQRAFARHSSPTSRALAACSLAISWTAFHVDSADRWVRRARTYDAECPLLGRAEAAITTARAGIAATVAAAEPAAPDPAA